MPKITFDSVNSVVTNYTSARRIPYSAEMLATEPETVYDSVVSFGFATGDRHAEDVAELLAKYMEVC